MKQEEVLSNLCYYDKRNPIHEDGVKYYEKSNKDVPGKCYCDNCFYGRTKLAEEILKLQELID